MSVWEIPILILSVMTGLALGHDERLEAAEILAILCACVTALLPSQDAAGAVGVCPVQSTDTHQVRIHGDTCYQFHLRETRGFSAAQAEYHSQGGSEVVIKDADTQRFLFDVLQREMHYKGVVWIGLTDVLKEGTFSWIDGSPLTFSFWAAGQPGSLVGTVEDCVVMDMSDGGRWHDYRCEDFLFFHDPHPFICQFDLKYTGSTVTLPAGSTTMEVSTASAAADTTIKQTATIPPDVATTI